MAERAEKSISEDTDAADSTGSSSNETNTESNTFDSGKSYSNNPLWFSYFLSLNHAQKVLIISTLRLTFFNLVPDLENCDPSQELGEERTVSTPITRPVTRDQFDALCGRVDDLLDKFYGEQNKSSSAKDSLVQLERKLEHLEGDVLPDLKNRIKTVKKSIPSDVSQPLKNKEAVEQLRAQLERARAKIAVLESQKPEQKIKISDTSIATLFGKKSPINLTYYNL